MVIGIALVAVVAVVAGAAVLLSAPPKDVEVDDREVVTVTDLMGTSVNVKYPVKRVVLGSMDEVDFYAAVYGEGWEKTIVMWPSDMSTRDPSREAAYFGKYPSLKGLPKSPDMFQAPAFPVELLMKQNADLILLPASSMMWRSWNAETWKLLTESGTGVVTLDMYTDPFNKIAENVNVLSKITKNTERAAGINAMFDKNIKKVMDVMKTIPDSKKGLSIYIEIPGLDPVKYGSSPAMGTPEFDMLGSKNAAVEYHKKKNLQYTAEFTFNYEMLQAEKPDVFVFAMSSYYGSKEAKLFGFNMSSSKADLEDAASKYLNRPGFGELKAVKDKKCFMYIAELRNTFASFANLQYVAKALYPEEFKNLDPYANLMEFDATYLPVYTSGTFFHYMCT